MGAVSKEPPDELDKVVTDMGRAVVALIWVSVVAMVLGMIVGIVALCAGGWAWLT